jgi:ABC-2 type transport system ATP-binding protein
MSILVESVVKRYGEQLALNNVSFSIGRGEVVGFLGPNGAGKSTMMKIISCYLPQTSGRVEVGGFDVREQSIEVRRRVGYLPENNPLYLDMYVREFLHFIGGIQLGRKKAAAEAQRMIELTGLGPEQHKKIGALSKGYRQRVGLAQALIHDPSVLVLDEPTTGLDPNQLQGIRELIREIGKQKTVVFSTHIMQEVEAVCDRVIIINKGVIVADQDTQKLKGGAGKTTRLLVEFDRVVQPDDLLAIAGVSSAAKVRDMLWRIEGASDTDLRKAVFSFAVDKGMTVLALQKLEDDLESVFRSLTSSST